MRLLREYITETLGAAVTRPRAFLVPHASPEYSGHIATELTKNIPDHGYDSIMLLGTDHEKPDVGIYTASDYRPDAPKISKLIAAGMPFVEGDHSIGNVIPLIQEFSDLPIVPVVVPEYSLFVSDVLRSILTPDTLVIGTADLSHYNPIEIAGELDHETVEKLRNRELGSGADSPGVIEALYDLTRGNFEPVDYDTSAHLEGDRDRVVGYVAMQAGGFSDNLLIAKRAVEDYIKLGIEPRPEGDDKAAFIGISKNGELQGSMGQTHPVMPASVAAVEAFKSTLTDGRMQYDPELVKTPGSGFEIKVRLFSDMVPTWLQDVKIGKDGIYVEAAEEKSAVFLPEVPTKQGWGHEEYLEELLDKADITDDESFQLYKFTTESIMIIT